MSRNARSLGLAGIGLCVLAVASTAPVGEDGAATGGNSASGSEAISSEAFSRMHIVVKAGEKDGELYAFALSPDWTDGGIIKTFSDKGDLKVNSAQPDGAGQYNVQAANRLKSTVRTPGVFDLNQPVAIANEDMSAPDQEQTADGIPQVKSLDDLLGQVVKGKVFILTVNAAQAAGAATSSVVTETVFGGGSTDNVPPGVPYLRKPEDPAPLLPADPTPPTGQSEQTSASSTTGSAPTPPR